MAEILVAKNLATEVANRIAPGEFPYIFADFGLGFISGAAGGAMLRYVHVRSRLDIKGGIGWTAFFALPFIAMLSVGITHHNPEEIGYGIAGLFGIASGYLGMMGISQSNQEN